MAAHIVRLLLGLLLQYSKAETDGMSGILVVRLPLWLAIIGNLCRYLKCALAIDLPFLDQLFMWLIFVPPTLLPPSPLSITEI